jgi:hypothetical protein
MTEFFVREDTNTSFKQTKKTHLSITMCAILVLQLFHPLINAGRRYPRRIEWLSQMYNGAARLHHWVLLIVLDQFTQCGKFFTATNIVLIVLLGTREGERD